jgi:hypothetical protein
MRGRTPQCFCVILAFLLSCCAKEGHWISKEELEPAPDPNIEALQLNNGSIIEFDKNLGWYNAQDHVIEGSLSRAPMRIPIEEIRNVKLAGEATIWLGLGLFFLLAAVGLIVALFAWISNHGGL